MNISSSWPRCWGWWPGWLWWWEGYWWMHCSEVAAAVGTSSVSTPATTYCSTLSTVHSTMHCTVHTVHLLAVSLMWTFAVSTSVHPTITVRVDSELCTCICDLNIRSSSNIRVDVRQCQIYCVMCALVLHFYFFCAVCILLSSVVGSCVALQEVVEWQWGQAASSGHSTSAASTLSVNPSSPSSSSSSSSLGQKCKLWQEYQ